MTQLTPEELAACRAAFELEYGLRDSGEKYWQATSAFNKEWEAWGSGFAAGLSHARAEAAKEIADLKAQVEGMRKLLEDIATADSEGVCDSGWSASFRAKEYLAQEKPNDC